MCVGLVAMMSARAAGNGEGLCLAYSSDNKAGASEQVSAINACLVCGKYFLSTQRADALPR